MTIIVVILTVLVIPVAAYLLKGGSSGGRYTKGRGYRGADGRTVINGQWAAIRDRETAGTAVAVTAGSCT